jgi:hypothetical protein
MSEEPLSRTAVLASQGRVQSGAAAVINDRT